MRGKGKRERGESGAVARRARGPKGDKEPAESKWMNYIGKNSREREEFLSRGQAMPARRTLEQIGTERCWQNLAARVWGFET